MATTQPSNELRGLRDVWNARPVAHGGSIGRVLSIRIIRPSPCRSLSQGRLGSWDDGWCWTMMIMALVTVNLWWHGWLVKCSFGELFGALCGVERCWVILAIAECAPSTLGNLPLHSSSLRHLQVSVSKNLKVKLQVPCEYVWMIGIARVCYLLFSLLERGSPSSNPVMKVVDRLTLVTMTIPVAICSNQT